MKIVGLAAGRKNGNSELLMKHAMLTMREQLDLEFTIIRLSDLDIEHCSGCSAGSYFDGNPYFFHGGNVSKYYF